MSYKFDQNPPIGSGDRVQSRSNANANTVRTKSNALTPHRFAGGGGGITTPCINKERIAIGRVSALGAQSRKFEPQPRNTKGIKMELAAPLSALA